MARFNPRDVLSSYGSIAALNANFDDISALMEKALFRDGSGSNAMSATLDMNHRPVKNLGAPSGPNDAARVIDLAALVPETALSALLATGAGTGYIKHQHRTLLDKLTETNSVLDSPGVTNDGLGDSSAGIQSAIDTLHAEYVATGSPRELFFPAGDYNLGTSGILGRAGVSLIGLSQRTRFLTATTGQGFKLAPSQYYGHAAIKNITLVNTLQAGGGTEAFDFSSLWMPGTGPDGIGHFSGINVHLEGLAVQGIWVNGFKFSNFFGGSVRNLTTETAIISNACYLFYGDVNATHWDQLYTSTSNNHDYCFLFDMSEDEGGYQPLGIGNNFTALTCQGGKYGIYIRHGKAMKFDTIYFENVSNPVVIGSVPSGLISTSIEMNNLIIHPPTSSKELVRGMPAIRMQFCQDVKITNIALDGYGIYPGIQPEDPVQTPKPITYGNSCRNITIDGIRLGQTPAYNQHTFIGQEGYGGASGVQGTEGIHENITVKGIFGLDGRSLEVFKSAADPAQPLAVVKGADENGPAVDNRRHIVRWYNFDGTMGQEAYTFADVYGLPPLPL